VARSLKQFGHRGMGIRESDCKVSGATRRKLGNFLGICTKEAIEVFSIDLGGGLGPLAQMP